MADAIEALTIPAPAPSDYSTALAQYEQGNIAELSGRPAYRSPPISTTVVILSSSKEHQ